MRRAFETVRIRCYTLNPSYYSKLSTFGIKDPLLTWFHSYQTGRSQRVVINGTSSRWTDVGSDVPQGSRLGPILFLLFVNDMPNVVTSATLAMFADDSKCYKVTNHHSDYLHLQQDLDALPNWSVLFFQPTKCSNLRISRKHLCPPRSYVLNGINVEVVTAEKRSRYYNCKWHLLERSLSHDCG